MVKCGVFVLFRIKFVIPAFLHRDKVMTKKPESHPGFSLIFKTEKRPTFFASKKIESLFANSVPSLFTLGNCYIKTKPPIFILVRSTWRASYLLALRTWLSSWQTVPRFVCLPPSKVRWISPFGYHNKLSNLFYSFFHFPLKCDYTEGWIELRPNSTVQI